MKSVERTNEQIIAEAKALIEHTPASLGVFYWGLILSTSLLVLLELALAVATYVDVRAHMADVAALPWKEMATVGALLLTTVTTFAGIVFAWRLDRRQSRELILKIKELELRISRPAGLAPDMSQGEGTLKAQMTYPPILSDQNDQRAKRHTKLT